MPSMSVENVGLVSARSRDFPLGFRGRLISPNQVNLLIAQTESSDIPQLRWGNASAPCWSRIAITNDYPRNFSVWTSTANLK